MVERDGDKHKFLDLAKHHQWENLFAKLAERPDFVNACVSSSLSQL